MIFTITSCLLIINCSKHYTLYNEYLLHKVVIGFLVISTKKDTTPILGNQEIIEQGQGVYSINH